MYILTNFIQQLKFLAIVLGTSIIIQLSCNLNFTSTVVYLILQCIILLATLIFFLGKTFDVVKDSHGLRRFEYIVYLIGGGVIALCSIIDFFQSRSYYGWRSTLSADIIGILFNSPLHIFIAWQIKTSGGESSPMRPIYFAFAFGNNPLKIVEQAEYPPKYPEVI